MSKVNNIVETVSSSKYVVVRDGLRNSEIEYSSEEEAKNSSEMKSLKNILKRWPDGSQIKVEPYDEVKHKIT